jgi:hypothetical protein
MVRWSAPGEEDEEEEEEEEEGAGEEEGVVHAGERHINSTTGH